MSQVKRITLKSNVGPHFIGCWQLPDTRVCDGIIKFFESNRARQRPGSLDIGIDRKSKRSTDIIVKPNEVQTDSEHAAFATYMEGLQACYQDYLDQWPFLARFLDEVHIGTFNVQRYEPGEHFAKVHSERTSLATLHRILVWMTYLNDVEDGGETHFEHYRLTVKPRCGKTLIWPAEWTHAHAGWPVSSGTKYIVTGWMHFPHET